MTLEDAEKLALTTLKETMEEKISHNNVQMMVIKASDKKVIRYSAENVENILKAIK